MKKVTNFGRLFDGTVFPSLLTSNSLGNNMEFLLSEKNHKELDFCLFAALVNKLWKRMDKLESEKRNLQIKLDQPISEPPSPR
jgi:hypothetical protein